MTIICRYCFFRQTAERLKVKAKYWDDLRLRCLGGPHVAASLEFEAMAEGEGRCRCDEPPPEPFVFKKKKPKTESVIDSHEEEYIEPT